LHCSLASRFNKLNDDDDDDNDDDDVDEYGATVTGPLALLSFISTNCLASVQIKSNQIKSFVCLK